jgi:nucleotide-binding universal stress UspA family protein
MRGGHYNSVMRTILLGYDGTDVADRALDRTAELAERFGSRVVVLTVGRSARNPRPELVPETAGPLMTAGVMTSAPPPMSPAPVMEAELDEPAMRMLERARGTLTARGIDADYISAVGDPAEALLEAADERDADLVVVGSREHGFIERLLGAGVDEKVARKTRRDVLLVH